MRLYTTEKVDQSIARAKGVAESLGIDCIQTQHVLVALLENRKSGARLLFDKLKQVSLEEVTKACMDIKQPSIPDPRPKETVLTVSATAVKDCASKIAHEQGHSAITTAHYLVACLTVDCFAKTKLKQHGATLEAAMKLLNNPKILAAG